MSDQGRAFLVLHPDDNVATLIDERVDMATLADGRPVQPGVAFGHKCAIAAIAAGDPVVKYGVAIGRSLSSIQPGEHVHVHNCR
jgi:hypothetical protein